MGACGWSRNRASGVPARIRSRRNRARPGAILLAVASATAVALATAACIFLGIKRRDPLRFVLGVTVLCCPVILYLPVFLSRPVFVYHVVPSFWLSPIISSLAFAIGALKPPAVRWAAVVALVTLSLIAIRGVSRSQRSPGTR
jgi:hypothetical protein